MKTTRTDGSGAWCTTRPEPPNAIRLVRILLCLFLAVGSTLSLVVPAHAAEDQPSAITVSPTREKLALNPGEGYDGTFEVFNSGTSSAEFQVYVSPYQISDIDYENPDFETDAPRTQLSRWVTLQSDTVSLEANELATIPYRIDVPMDVPAGGQYAAMFVETRVADEADSSVVTKSRAGMLLYVTVNGDTREAGSITEQRVPFWQPAAPLVGTTIVENTGNTDFFVGSQFRVSTIFGSEVFEFSRQSPVLPDTSRRIILEWPDSTPGIYQVTTTTSILGDDTVSTSWVFVVPLSLLIGVILGLVVVIGGLWWRRYRQQRKVARAVEAAVSEALSAAQPPSSTTEAEDGAREFDAPGPRRGKRAADDQGEA